MKRLDFCLYRCSDDLSANTGICQMLNFALSVFFDKLFDRIRHIVIATFSSDLHEEIGFGYIQISTSDLLVYVGNSKLSSTNSNDTYTVFLTSLLLSFENIDI